MDFNPSTLIVPGIVFAALLGIIALSSAWQKKLRKKHGRTSDMFFRYLHAPVEILLAWTAVYIVVRRLELRWTEDPMVQQVYMIGMTLLACWLAVQAMHLFSALFLRKYDAGKKDNPDVRATRAKVRLVRRVVITAIVIIGLGSVLMTFEETRTLGFSMLAVMGAASVILGLAAHKTLGTLFTGIQIAVAKPIRIDDVVMIEGEQGRIEAITLTFVVVNTADQRRLVLPIGYFADRPFENGTRPVDEAGKDSLSPLGRGQG